MATFFRSFVEAMAPGREIPSPVREAQESKGPQTAQSGGGPQPQKAQDLNMNPRVMLPSCLEMSLQMIMRLRWRN